MPAAKNDNGNRKN